MAEEFKEIIKDWDDERLSHGYQLYNKRLDEPRYILKREELESRIRLIRDEWGSRSSNEGNYSWPERGLLSVMGYRVGITEGIKEGIRRRILKDVISGPLPLVGNSGYMAEWGEDGSNERIEKTKNCLKGFVHGRQHLDHDIAIQDWTTDLGWLNENY
tara:strand:- start:140 stop:613 length:474 start_codon:yes stop_codon:yes gene_type:complete